MQNTIFASHKIESIFISTERPGKFVFFKDETKYACLYTTGVGIFMTEKRQIWKILRTWWNQLDETSDLESVLGEQNHLFMSAQKEGF